MYGDELKKVHRRKLTTDCPAAARIQRPRAAAAPASRPRLQLLDMDRLHHCAAWAQCRIGISRIRYVERSQGLTETVAQILHVTGADRKTRQILRQESNLGQQSDAANCINRRAHVMKMSCFDRLSQQSAELERNRRADCHVTRVGKLAVIEVDGAHAIDISLLTRHPKVGVCSSGDEIDVLEWTRHSFAAFDRVISRAELRGPAQTDAVVRSRSHGEHRRVDEHRRHTVHRRWRACGNDDQRQDQRAEHPTLVNKKHGCLHDSLPKSDRLRKRLRPSLLETQEHEDLSRPTGQRLECFADQRSGTMNASAPDLDRHRLHR